MDYAIMDKVQKIFGIELIKNMEGRLKIGKNKI